MGSRPAHHPEGFFWQVFKNFVESDFEVCFLQGKSYMANSVVKWGGTGVEHRIFGICYGQSCEKFNMHF